MRYHYETGFPGISEDDESLEWEEPGGNLAIIVMGSKVRVATEAPYLPGSV